MNLENQNEQNQILLNNQYNTNLNHYDQQLQSSKVQQLDQSDVKDESPSKIYGTNIVQEKIKQQKQLQEQLQQLQSEIQAMEYEEIKSGVKQENSFNKEKQINRRLINNDSSNDEYFRRILELEKQRKTLKQSKEERIQQYESALKEQMQKEKQEAKLNKERMKQLQKINSERGYSYKQRQQKEESYRLKDSLMQKSMFGNLSEKYLSRQSTDLDEKKKQLASIREISKPIDYMENKIHQEQFDMRKMNREQRQTKSEWHYEKPKTNLSQTPLRINQDINAIQMDEESNHHLKNEIQDPFSSQKKTKQLSSHILSLNNSQLSARNDQYMQMSQYNLTTNNIIFQIQENLAKKKRVFDSKNDKKKFFDYVQQEYRKRIGFQYMGSTKNWHVQLLNTQIESRQIINQEFQTQENTPQQQMNAIENVKPFGELTVYSQRAQNSISPGKITGVESHFHEIQAKLSLIDQIQDEAYDMWKQRYQSRIIKSGSDVIQIY